MLFMGAGMGLAGAPATDSIMGALPRDRAGIGSAVNDTTRGARWSTGVAIVGSIMSSVYGHQLAGGLPKELPDPVAEAARESVGAAVQVGSQVADTAREAFADTNVVGFDCGCVHCGVRRRIAWRYLPAHAAVAQEDEEVRDVARMDDATAQPPGETSGRSVNDGGGPRRMRRGHARFA